jgi:hypothetical protein
VAINTSDIINTIEGLIKENKAKTLDIPAPLILFGARNKNGLSARDIAKEVIIRKSEAGAPVGPLPDGSDSVDEKMEFIRAQVYINHLLENAKITVVVPPGTPVITFGSNSGGPVTSEGVTKSYAVGRGIIQ